MNISALLTELHNYLLGSTNFPLKLSDGNVSWEYA